MQFFIEQPASYSVWIYRDFIDAVQKRRCGGCLRDAGCLRGAEGRQKLWIVGRKEEQEGRERRRLRRRTNRWECKRIGGWFGVLSESLARPMPRRLYRFTTERRTSVKRYLLTVDFPWPLAPPSPPVPSHPSRRGTSPLPRFCRPPGAATPLSRLYRSCSERKPLLREPCDFHPLPSRPHPSCSFSSLLQHPHRWLFYSRPHVSRKASGKTETREDRDREDALRTARKPSGSLRRYASGSYENIWNIFNLGRRDNASLAADHGPTTGIARGILCPVYPRKRYGFWALPGCTNANGEGLERKERGSSLSEPSMIFTYIFSYICTIRRLTLHSPSHSIYVGW